MLPPLTHPPTLLGASFDGYGDKLIVGGDGTIYHVGEVFPADTYVLEADDASGQPLWQVPVSSPRGDVRMGADGTLYMTMPRLDGRGNPHGDDVTALDRDGGTRWTVHDPMINGVQASADGIYVVHNFDVTLLGAADGAVVRTIPIEFECVANTNYFADCLAVGPTGVLAGVSGAGVTSLDPATGATWTYAVSAAGGQTPAIAADGTVAFVALYVHASVVAVAPDGQARFATQLGERVQLLGLGPDGSAYVVSTQQPFSLTAVDPTGHVAWQRPIEDVPWDFGVDAAGTLYYALVTMTAVAPDGTDAGAAPIGSPLVLGPRGLYGLQNGRFCVITP